MCFAIHCTDMSFGSASHFENEQSIGNPPYANGMSLSLFSSPPIIYRGSRSPPHFPSATLPPCLSSQPWLTSPGADLCLVWDSLLLLICLLSSSTSCQACRPPGEDGMDGSSPCIRDCLLQLSAATVLVGGTLIVIPDVTLLCEKVQTVSSSGRPVVKNSMKMDSSVHPKLLNSIRILVSSEQSS